MEPTIVALKRSTFSYRAGRLALGVDTLTIDHPKLQHPLAIPVSTITKVIAGSGPEVCRRTTIPAGVDPKGATLVLVLAAPAKVWLRGTLSREYSEIALAVADPAQARIALSRLRVEPPAPPTEQQLRAARPLRVVLGAVLPVLVLAAVTFGIQYGLRQAFPSSASAADKAAQKAADAEKTDGRTLLAAVPQVLGAIAFRATATDGSRLYAWRTGDRLRLRVDSAPRYCADFGWRLWWKTMDHRDIPIAPSGAFRARGRTVEKLAVGGIDTATSLLQGRIAGDRLTARYVRHDAYRSAAGYSTCHRAATFSARRSG